MQQQRFDLDGFAGYHGGDLITVLPPAKEIASLETFASHTPAIDSTTEMHTSSIMHLPDHNPGYWHGSVAMMDFGTGVAQTWLDHDILFSPPAFHYLDFMS